MIYELQCRHCSWQSTGYSDDVLGVIEIAKEHSKKHKLHWKYWAMKGKVILEMFKVISVDGE